MTEINHRYALQVYNPDIFKRPARSNVIASRICKLRIYMYYYKCL